MSPSADTSKSGSAQYYLPAALHETTIPAIDGLRAIAVMLVVFFHLGFLYIDGPMGVMIFFVISGFLITWLMLKEEKKSGKISIRRFYIRRVLRIFPAFYFYWLIVVLIVGVAIGKNIVWPQAVASFLFMNNYFQAFYGDPNTTLSHTWSIGVEEQFYILWPLLFVILKNNSNRIYFLICVIPLIWLYRLTIVLLFDASPTYVNYALETRADHLLVGCLLATILFEGKAVSFCKAMVLSPALLWVTVLLLALSSMMAHFVPWPYKQTIGFILEPTLAAVLVLQAVNFYTGTAKWMNWGWIVYIGRISYSIYLYQQVAIRPLLAILVDVPVPVATAGAVLGVVAIASVSFYCIERPFLALKANYGGRLPRSPAFSVRRLFSSVKMPAV